MFFGLDQLQHSNAGLFLADTSGGLCVIFLIAFPSAPYLSLLLLSAHQKGRNPINISSRIAITIHEPPCFAKHKLVCAGDLSPHTLWLGRQWEVHKPSVCLSVCLSFNKAVKCQNNNLSIIICYLSWCFSFPHLSLH